MRCKVVDARTVGGAGAERSRGCREGSTTHADSRLGGLVGAARWFRLRGAVVVVGERCDATACGG
jgi:hypothetical protein